MIKRLLSLLLILTLSLSSASAASKRKRVSRRYDFDLSFSLNPEAFPAKSRSRARGYAELLDLLELKGDIVICEAKQSFDINATLFFKNNPDVSIPFRFYGTPKLLFLTSPIIGNETLLFNMVGLAEFSIKMKKNLDTPLPALALLYPVVYEHNLWYVREAFEKYTGPNDVSREISADRITELADTWAGLIESDTDLNVWMTALTSVSSASEAVEAELNGVPSYLLDFVSRGEPLTVEIGDGTETWQNASGVTLFSREKTDKSETWSLTLPQDENRYAPTASFARTNHEDSFSFTLDGSMIRGKLVLPPGISEEDFTPVTGSEEEDGENAEESEGEVYPLTGSENESDGEREEESEGGEEEEEDSQWPETMLRFSVSGNGLPSVFPCDSSFSITASITGAMYPDFNLSILGKTEKGGAASVSFCQPSDGAAPEPMLTFEGTVVPSSVPVEKAPNFNYKPEKLYGTYNFFSFSEYYVAKFKNAVTEPLIKGLLDFVAAAPTAACQSFLDDLTDSGVLNMMTADQ